METDLIITGVGLTCGLGVGVERCWDRICAGETGLRALTGIEAGAAARGAEAPRLAGAPEPDDRRDRAHAHLLAVCDEALASAGIPGGRAPVPERASLFLGSTLAAQASAPAFWSSYLARGPQEADFRSLKSYDVELRIADLCDRLDVQGESALVTSACAAGASALSAAADVLRLGRADLAVVAGWDAIDLHTYAGFNAIKALSSTAPRPFAPDRDGMLLGEGFAALVLERADAAGERRGLARLRGYGESSDAYHLTKPEPHGAGAALAMRRALARAGLEPEAIDAINLHCTSTPANDLAEVRAMRAVFGERLDRLPLVASKPALGHTLGGAGAVEAILALLSLRDGRLPPTLNVGARDPECGSLDVVTAARSGPLQRVMSNSFGFGGCNASLILEAVE